MKAQASISPMTPDEELAAFFAQQRSHLACLVQKDGLVHMRVAPDYDSAVGHLLQLMLAHGPGFNRAFVRACCGRENEEAGAPFAS